MKNTDLICKKLDESLAYLYEQEEKLKPVLDLFLNIVTNKAKQDDISFKDALQMLIQTQQQYTNTILLITKIREIIDFKL